MTDAARAKVEADPAKALEKMLSKMDDEDKEAFNWWHRHAKATGAREAATQTAALLGLQDWILAKLKTMRTYHAPTDGRAPLQEIQGWLHVLCAAHQTLDEVLPEFDRRGRETAALRAALSAIVEKHHDTVTNSCRQCGNSWGKPHTLICLIAPFAALLADAGPQGEEWRALNECFEASKAYNAACDVAEKTPDEHLADDLKKLQRWEDSIAAVEKARQPKSTSSGPETTDALHQEGRS